MDNIYRIAINRIPLIDKPNSDFPWPEYMAAFEPHELTPGELLWKIGHGFGFAPIFGEDGYPTMEKWIESQFIAIDIDDERTTLDELSKHELVAYHGAIVYPTHSHTAEAPRHRVVFLLDQPVRNATTYRLLYSAIASMFPGADHSVAPNKTWMGNGKIDFHKLWGLCRLPKRFVFTPEQVVTYMMAERKREEEKKSRLERLRGLMRPPREVGEKPKAKDFTITS